MRDLEPTGVGGSFPAAVAGSRAGVVVRVQPVPGRALDRRSALNRNPRSN
jgi:hypothetical protein